MLTSRAKFLASSGLGLVTSIQHPFTGCATVSKPLSVLWWILIMQYLQDQYENPARRPSPRVQCLARTLADSLIQPSSYGPSDARLLNDSCRGSVDLSCAS